ncbi:MAG: hypothetical protein IPJ85_14130 [Flavobacteriales bacterium]|nr:hypothetical protein [Flavobacteriales bacterium]
MTAPTKPENERPTAASTYAMAKELLLRMTPWLAIIFIFIVPIVILVMMAMAFLCLPMGRDVVVVSNEKQWSMLFANMATVLIAYVLWYLPRLLAYTHDHLLKHHPNLRRHLPPLLPRPSTSCCWPKCIAGPTAGDKLKRGDWPALACYLYGTCCCIASHSPCARLPASVVRSSTTTSPLP